MRTAGSLGGVGDDPRGRVHERPVRRPTFQTLLARLTAELAEFERGLAIDVRRARDRGLPALAGDLANLLERVRAVRGVGERVLDPDRV